jgi:hypothetical protein
MMSRCLPAWIAALHACACLGLHAQTAPAAPTEPQALVTLRSTLLRQVMSDSQLLTEQYERALAKAEVEVAALGDYEEARAIRQRREQLKALYTGTASSLATPLLLAQARLTGSAQFSGEMLSGWRSNGSGAEWLNFRLVPGRYHLEFEANMSDAPVAGSIYASSKFQPQQTAMFEFNEIGLLGPSLENRRSFEIVRSADETTFATVRVGPLTFTRSPVTLRFTSAAGYPANTIRLRNFRLVPITDEGSAGLPATTPAINGTDALQQATAQLRDALETARKAAAVSYLAGLEKLADSQPALKRQVEVETRRMSRLADQKTGPTGIRAITTAAGGLNGFEDISDARLAAAEPASGDRFKVNHEGRELSIRLLWVKCAPADEKDAGAKNLARQFKIAEEDVISIGRFAREFTAGYLRDKPLRLLVRPDRDKDGTQAALLFLPDVGLYQNVLVDHGLAAVQPPPRDLKRNATEKALISMLEARENETKERKPPPGAWALQPEGNGGDRP